MKCVLHVYNLKKIIKGTKDFVSKSCLYQQELQYVHIIVDAEKLELRAEACDGHKISIEYCKLVGCEESFECFIKPILPKYERGEEYAEIEYVNEKAYITVGESIIGFVQPKTTFPDVNKFIDAAIEENPVETITVDAVLLSQAVKAVTNNKTYKPYIKIDVRKPLAPVIIRNDGKDIKLVLPVHSQEEENDG